MDASIDAATLVGELTDVTAELIDVTSSENAALRVMNRARLEELLPRKEKTSRRYVELLRILRFDASDIASVPDVARARLREIVERFHAVADENASLLEGMKQASEKLVRTVADALKEQEPSVQAYSKAGTLSGYSRQGIGARPFAVSLNCTL